MNHLDGDWYEERNPVNPAENIDIPVYLQIDQGRGWTLDGHIELFNVLKGPKKLDIGSYPPMQSRPWIEEHDKMFRWYEYWLKGIDNGIMDEPAVSVFVEGSREVVTAAEWPPKEIEHKPLYLRPRHKLSFEPEFMGVEYAAPDGFYQAPLTVTDKVEVLKWSTEPFEEPAELIGTGAAHLFAEIDQDDTNFILRLWDEAPGGGRQLITSGYLKASHHELDEERTTEGNPYHPHTRAVPVEPGKTEEYVLRLYPFAATFEPGHRLVVELSNNEPLVDAHNALLPPDAFHLPVGRPVTHKIYRRTPIPARAAVHDGHGGRRDTVGLCAQPRRRAPQLAFLPSRPSVDRRRASRPRVGGASPVSVLAVTLCVRPKCCGEAESLGSSSCPPCA
ncbi:CocE/NonD family hydrolase C-terminal non-catalytic domain-containing protein [Streptomyces sp. NPDC057557]|uniref:CocE/NonD family hydrolase C-terminal non-catalytic domain-containing protein n=1 Tax=Streptomyces sp. NPDC057557 TaxID=3346167 RepID=UPI0036965DB6